MTLGLYDGWKVFEPNILEDNASITVSSGSDFANNALNENVDKVWTSSGSYDYKPEYMKLSLNSSARTMDRVFLLNHNLKHINITHSISGNDQYVVVPAAMGEWTVLNQVLLGSGKYYTITCEVRTTDGSQGSFKFSAQTIKESDDIAIDGEWQVKTFTFLASTGGLWDVGLKGDPSTPIVVRNLVMSEGVIAGVTNILTSTSLLSGRWVKSNCSIYDSNDSYALIPQDNIFSVAGTASILTSANDYTISCQARYLGDGGAATFELSCNRGVGSSGDLTLTPEWQQFTFTGTATSTGAGIVTISNSSLAPVTLSALQIRDVGIFQGVTATGTNLITSDDISDSNWTKTNLSVCVGDFWNFIGAKGLDYLSIDGLECGVGMVGDTLGTISTELVDFIDTNHNYDTAYYEFNKVSVDSLLIISRTTRPVNQEKRIGYVIGCEEIGTISASWVGVPSFSFSNNVAQKKGLNNKAFVKKRERVASCSVRLSKIFEQNDYDLVRELSTRQNPFLFWACGGLQPDDFKLSIEGYRLQDVYQMQDVSSMQGSFTNSLYNGTVPQSLRLQEVN